jgi:hypothetical protein
MITLTSHTSDFCFKCFKTFGYVVVTRKYIARNIFSTLYFWNVGENVPPIALGQ